VAYERNKHTMVERVIFHPDSSRPEQGIEGFDPSSILLPVGFTVVKALLYRFAPGGWGGDHTHPHREIFMSIGEGMYLSWRDKDGTVRHEQMQEPDGTMQVFSVEPHTPHLVTNRSPDSIGVLYELRNTIDPVISRLEGPESLRSQ
jgi:quercetin dioxygenase-like cupin family protein